MSEDIRWPTEVRGGHKLVAWLNRLLAACKKSAITQIKVVGGSGKLQDGRIIISMNEQESSSQMFPFKIYNTSNASATDAQKDLFTVAQLDINAFTFQIRGGLIGFRSYVNLLGQFNGYMPIVPEIEGNFEQLAYSVCTDSAQANQANPSNTYDFYYPPSSNTGVCTVLDDVNPTLLVGIPAGSPAGTAFIFSNQIALNPNSDGTLDFTNFAAGFWIEIVDDANNGIYANLMGRMYNLDVAGRRVENPFPTGSNIIPLGVVKIGYVNNAGTGPTAWTIEQYQTGNLVNRFLPELGNQRGKWSEIFADLPAGKTQLMFYPGDIVIDDTNSIAWGISGNNYFGIYQFIAVNPAAKIVSAVPLAISGDWNQIGMYPN